MAVTGHEGGNFYLWRVRKIPSMFDGSPSFMRRLYVAYAPPKTHKACITSIRLSATMGSRAKDLVVRSYDDANSLDLLVGDAEGFVSRWAALRLDQAGEEAANVLSERALHFDSTHMLATQSFGPSLILRMPGNIIDAVSTTVSASRQRVLSSDD